LDVVVREGQGPAHKLVAVGILKGEGVSVGHHHVQKLPLPLGVHIVGVQVLGIHVVGLPVQADVWGRIRKTTLTRGSNI
jgi:hypothetical protein